MDGLKFIKRLESAVPSPVENRLDAADALQKIEGLCHLGELTAASGEADPTRELFAELKGYLQMARRYLSGLIDYFKNEGGMNHG